MPSKIEVYSSFIGEWSLMAKLEPEKSVGFNYMAGEGRVRHLRVECLEGNTATVVTTSPVELIDIGEIVYPVARLHIQYQMAYLTEGEEYPLRLTPANSINNMERFLKISHI